MLAADTLASASVPQDRGCALALCSAPSQRQRFVDHRMLGIVVFAFVALMILGWGGSCVVL